MLNNHRAFVLAFFLAAPLAVPAAQASPLQQSMDQRSQRIEQHLKNEVRHQLVMLPYYSVFDNLQYKVEGDKVTLLGQVIRPPLKSDAQNVVKSIEGVATVDNQIEVLPPSPLDDRIRRAEYRAIYGASGLFLYAQQAVPSIHIIVKNGHVTLEGVVARDADKQLAGVRANSVPNVFSVTNNLVVEKH